MFLYLVNGGHHNNLYKYDMRPVFRSNSTNNKWVRLKMPVKQRRSESGDTILLFEHTVELENDKIFFAFTYPYSYANLMSDLAVLDNHVNDFANFRLRYGSAFILGAMGSGLGYSRHLEKSS